MTDPVQTVKDDAAAVKAWYKQYPVYAGAIAGAVLHSLAVHFLHFPL
jgi:hypothetical protein